MPPHALCVLVVISRTLLAAFGTFIFAGFPRSHIHMYFVRYLVKLRTVDIPRFSTPIDCVNIVGEFFVFPMSHL